MLQGTLDTFELGDVLTLLATTGKSGRLHLNGDRGTGSLWFDGGEVVAATAANVPADVDPTDVLFELLRYGRGEFTFVIGESAPEAGPPHAVAPLLHRANETLSEWRELTNVVPSLSHRVALVADLVDEHVTLDRGQWRTVLAIGGGLSVAALGESLDMAEVPVLRRVCDLLDRGLVEVLEPASAQSYLAPAAPVLAAPSPVEPVAHGTEPTFAPEEPQRRWDDQQPEPAVHEAPAPEVGGHTLVEQLGGLSPRAAQAVSEAAARGAGEDSVLLSFLRSED